MRPRARALALALSLALASSPALADPPALPPSTLTPFGTASALYAAVAPVLSAQRRAVARERARERGRRHARARAPMRAMGDSGRGASPAPSAASPTASRAPATSASAAPGITNNQEQGVDEGDIVKTHGEHLIVLRRGRLFTVRVGDPALAAHALTPRAMVNAYAPGSAPADWYDELLVDGDTLLVTGFSYERGQTEIGRFRVDAEGRITYRDTLYLRTGDYFSSRNYASRLVGHQLVVYLPIPMIRETDGGDFVAQRLPAMRQGRGAWRPVADFAGIYRANLGCGAEPVLHTVLRCELSAGAPSCRAEGVLGPPSRSFYVSREAVYLWVTGAPEWEDWEGISHRDPRPGAAGSMLYRFPLSGGALTATRTRGAPVDQFSFRESPEGLRVVVRAEAQGDGMWSSELSEGDVALLTVPRERLRRTFTAMEPAAYRALPRPTERGAFQNRFVGDALLYGVGEGWSRGGEAPAHTLYVHDLARGTDARLALAHGIDRIEPLGRDALLVGRAGRDLHLSTVALDATPSVADRLVRAEASQSESRSHGFFFLPAGERQGTLGLPVTRAGRGAWRQLREGAAEVAFFRVDALRLREMGALRAEGGRSQRDDACVASCADWYGNARPIFWRGRVLALMGYELVEGVVDGERITERAHVDLFEALRPALASSPR